MRSSLKYGRANANEGTPHARAFAYFPIGHLDSRTQHELLRATVKTACESEQTRERELVLQLHNRRQPIHWRRAWWPSRSLAWLLPRDLPFKERFAVVDAVPTPTPTPLRDAIRARAELCLPRVRARRETACCRRVPTVAC